MFNNIDEYYTREVSANYWMEEEEMKLGIHPSQVKERIENALISKMGENFGEITFLDWKIEGSKVKVHLNNSFYGVFDYKKNEFENNSSQEDSMNLLKEYREKFGVEEVVNDMGEHRCTREGSIVFPNGWVASIVKNTDYPEKGKYSVAMCDYNGYFDWSILNKYGADYGRIYCNTELEILIACETIRRLQNTNVR